MVWTMGVNSTCVKYYQMKDLLGKKGDKTMLDKILSKIQLYSYLLPTCKIGNAIMDFRKRYTIK